MAESAVASVLLEHLSKMTVEEIAFLRGVNGEAELLRAELRRMQCFLKDADARRRRGLERERATFTNLVVDVRGAAYDAEDALEAANLHARSRALRRGSSGLGVLVWCVDLFRLHYFGLNIGRIRVRIREIHDSARAYGIAGPDEASVSVGPRDTSVERLYDGLRWVAGDDSSVVGLHMKSSEIRKILTDIETPQICVVSIVGMGGSGKSTLAREIYNFFHAQVAVTQQQHSEAQQQHSEAQHQHFEVFCWFVVPQKYKFIDIIKDIAKKMLNIKWKENVMEEKNKDGEGTSMDGGMENNQVTVENLEKMDEEQVSQVTVEKLVKKKGEQVSQVTVKDLEEMNEEQVSQLLRSKLAHRRFLVVLDDVWRFNYYNEINKILSIFPDMNNGSRVILTTRDLEVAKHVQRKNIIHHMELLDEGQSWELLEKKAYPKHQNVSPTDRSLLTPIGKKLAVKCKGLPLALVVLGGYLSRNLKYDTWSRLVDNLDWEARKDEEPVWDILARSFNSLPKHEQKSCFLYLAYFPEGHIIRVTKLIRLLIAEGFVPERVNRTMEETAMEYINELAQRCMLQVVDTSKVDGSIKSVALHDILRDWGVKEASQEGFCNIWSNTTPPQVYSSDELIPAYRIALHNFSSYCHIFEWKPKLRTLFVFGSFSIEFGLWKLAFLRVLDLYGMSYLYSLPSGIGKMMHLRYLGLENCESVYIPRSVSDLLNLQTLDARNSTTESLPPYFWDIPTLRHIHLTNVDDWAPPQVGRLQSLQSLHFSGVYTLRHVTENISKYRRMDIHGNRALKEENKKKWIKMSEALSQINQLVSLHLENFYRRGRFGEMYKAPFPNELINQLTRLPNLRELNLNGRSYK